MYRWMYGFLLLLCLISGCQQANEPMQEQMNSTTVQKVPDETEQIEELTLKVVYENGEEVRVHYVQNEEEQWVFHNDLLPAAMSEGHLHDKINQLTIDKGTFTEEVIQQMRYIFEFDGLYDELELEIMFDDGTTREYK